MGNPYEFSNAQWTRRCWSPFWRWITGTWPWVPVKETPLPADRYTAQDLVIPGSEGPVDTPPPATIKNRKINLPAPYKGYGCFSVDLPGTPYQVGNSSTHGWKTLTHFNLEYGNNDKIQFPAPKDHGGHWHREGAPLPSYVAAQGGWADNHICVYDEATGYFYEAIGYNVLFESVAAYGVFDGAGNLVEGRGVVWSKDPIGPYIFDLEHDQPHQLLLVVTMEAGGDNDAPQFPWVGRRLTLSSEAIDRIPDFKRGSVEDRFARSVSEYEIVMSDHGGGSSFRWVCGNQEVLQNLDWQGWELTLDDLVPCDGKTGF